MPRRYAPRRPARQPISQKSASSRVASLKIAIALAFVGAVVSESIASNVGIGYLMLSASATFRIPLVFAGLLVIAFMGIVMYMGAARLERRFASWAMRGSEIGGYMGGG